MRQEQPTDSDRLESLRRRISLLLLAGVSVGTTALIISMTVTTLAAEAISGSAGWSGVPVATSVLGTAAGTSLLSMAMTRWGRREGLLLFYTLGASGALIACVATVLASLPLLIGSLFVVGLGNSANALTRYVAADLQAPHRRATMVGWIVWAGTLGAVAGPNLLAPADRLGVAIALPPLAGAYLLSALLFASAVAFYGWLLRPDPAALVVPSTSEPRSGLPGAQGVGRLYATARVQVSVVTLVFGHAVMVLIMTMTPLHLRAAGHGLGVIGGVASAHIVGMFLFAPLVGLLVDRLGAVPMIFSGQGLLLLAAVGGLVVPGSRPSLVAATLFLLGLGWSCGYVAGSAHLTRGIAVEERAVLQGRTDSMVWVAAATASLLSSVLFSTIGFAGLCAVGVTAIALSATTIAVRQGSVARAGASAAG
jgi:MFS family permease